MGVEGEPYKDSPLPKADIVAGEEFLEKRGEHRRRDGAEKKRMSDTSMRGQRLGGTEERPGKDVQIRQSRHHPANPCGLPGKSAPSYSRRTA